jgi:hypothetical protein
MKKGLISSPFIIRQGREVKPDEPQIARRARSEATAAGEAEGLTDVALGLRKDESVVEADRTQRRSPEKRGAD